MMNPMDIFRLKGYWDSFKAAHPKLVPFAKSVYPAALGEGTIIDIRITDPDGRGYHYNLRVTEEDMRNLGEAKALAESMAREFPRS